ncbi:hypothetical protein D9611_004731 [Ephemerocybe angulata]|uniref:Nucleoporin Nup133/Nup155-like C-terminal domain-containing protein n=1 Tax=Ephemerocybe angulata TaxID=980116 RepID=A0A8H5B2V3_9AGAR|nr:hypothetical protein D9611_004731 [Tulosesus angulatus]
MATFSPSPAPRRSSRFQQRAGSPTRPRQRQHGSRLVSPANVPNRSLFPHATISNIMDVDETSSVMTDSPMFPEVTTYAKTDELSVTFYASLPVEVKRELRNADFFKTAYMGGIDTTTGFAVVASADRCFVWQHAQAIKGTPTCYIFVCPTDPDAVLPPPFQALVPHGLTQEPGLILLSHSGHIRFWQSIGIGLAGGDNFATFDLNLAEGDTVTNLLRVDSQLFVASTSQGLLYRLNLTSTGGKYHLATRVFSRPPPARSLSSLFPSFLGSSSSTLVDKSGAPQYIRSIALGRASPTGERDIWALGEERIQKWVMKPEGWEEKVIDDNLAETIKMVVQDSPSAEGDKLDLELLDLAINEAGTFIVLVSYAGKEESGNLRRLYSLIQLEQVEPFFSVAKLKTVPYQNTSAPTAPVVPRIQLLLSGAIVSVEFGDTVAFCSQDSDYQDRIQLKSVADRTLGVGVLQDSNSLLVLTASSMMQVHLSLDKIRNFSAQTGKTNLIKSIMMQAILYGSFPENPLHFSFPPEVDEDSLMRGAEQLSQAVLKSEPEVVRRNHDLTAQLKSRKDRLNWLIGFINENLVRGKMSQRSRQKLAVDAEKLHASYALWLQYNELLETSPKFSVLNDCVHAYMAEIGERSHEDVMRAFFRSKVSDIGRLIRKLVDVINLSAKQTGRDLSLLLPEANQIVITALLSATEFREANKQVYGIEGPMISSWTSRPGTIDVVLSLFDATTKVVEGANGDRSAPTKEPSSQLPKLAWLLFLCVEERLQWLSSPAAAEELNVSQDKDELETRFASLRPEVLDTLRRTGHHQEAFLLAEKYDDFASLVALCHRDTIYPPEANPHFERIQTYIKTYKENFTNELYQWYIQHGELRIMFSQEVAQSAFIDRFFEKKPNPGISWLHDISKERFADASSALLAESKGANNLDVKHLMLSIGKLATLADENCDETMLDAFHAGLNFVSVHDALIEEFRAALETVRGRHSLESQVDIIVKAKAPSLKETRGFAMCFKDLLKHLLQGKALSIEDAVDLLTLKDNDITTFTDFAVALQLLKSATDIPEGRRASAFRTVWRRVYLNDDWNALEKTANVSDSEIMERLSKTALYNTLTALLKSGADLDKEYNASPDVALIVPTQAEITSRWPGTSAELIEAIVEDYNYERDSLGELDLQDVYLRVKEMAIQDVWLSN